LIYTSTNSGDNWAATTAPTNQWTAVASSADGTQLIAADSGYGDGLIYTSSNSGSAWLPASGPVEYWTSVASSGDGSRLAASCYPGGIYTWQSIPVLNIMPASGNLVVSWQALDSATGFVLQAASDLATTNWVAVTNQPALTNGMNQVVIPLPPANNQFYRLVNP
jgi:hypothetical protein